MQTKTKKQFLILCASVTILFLFNSCFTCFISVDSFKQQFAGIDSTALKQVEIQGFTRFTCLANSLTIIQCVDKKGNPCVLKNKPSIEIRFTYGSNNKKVIFYFDSVVLIGNNIIGSLSRLIPLIKTIPLNEVSKIEVQDGKKNFKYVVNK
ncbi:MAG: hypothetical protein LBS69_03425 [Prevotellaceae bacterium]|nr:hypothetical protein [Prevotellaceae bacterium]